jgi:hypothetical protein
LELYCASSVGISLARVAAQGLTLKRLDNAFDRIASFDRILFSDTQGARGRSIDRYSISVRQVDAAVCRLTITSSCNGVGPLRSTVIARKVKAFRDAIEQSARSAGISFCVMKRVQ